LALVLTRPAGLQRVEFEQRLEERRPALAGLFLSERCEIRFGVQIEDDPLPARLSSRNLEPVDGSCEITLTGSDDLTQLVARAGDVGAILHGLFVPEHSAATIGAAYIIVPARESGVFLSMVFRREPTTSVQDFRTWWLEQHAPLVVELQGEQFTAYDQVHVDRALSARVSELIGVAYTPYDAYDVVGWETLYSFLTAGEGSADRAAKIRDDERGRIDGDSYRSSLMRAPKPA
jgi:hypothetical protein